MFNKLIKPYSYSYTQHNKVRFVRAGKPYFDVLKQLINAAQQTIHLQYYIYDDDETGMEVSKVLIQAAQRGVQVFIIVDGYASKGLSKSFIKELESSGIHFKFFNPIFKSQFFYFGRRLHHKVLVVDALYSLVGGINISNKYNDTIKGNAWLDFAVSIEGEISKELCFVCEKFWKTPKIDSKNNCAPIVSTQHYTNLPNCLIRMRRNDWVWAENKISATYFEMFRTCTSHITILSSYFLPGRIFRKHLAKATKRGIKVKIIVAGLSDVMLAKYAERFMYKWLLKNKIEIYEYQKNILHGKVAVCDGRLVTIGSYNINNLSAYVSLELNVDINNIEFSREIESTIDGIIMNECIPITEEKFNQTTPFFKYALYWTSYQIIRVVFNLCTFYFKQKRR